MSRLNDRLEAKSDLQEQIAIKIWKAMDPACMVITWDQVNSDDRATCLEVAQEILDMVKS